MMFNARFLVDGCLCYCSLPITVGLTAMFEKESYFRVKCHVEKKLDPLLLTVKGEGYSIKSMLLFEDPNGRKTEFSHTSPCSIDFGTVSTGFTFNISAIALFCVRSELGQ